MADLLPTLASDDENYPVEDESSVESDDDNQHRHPQDDDWMHSEFQFGGILGEDGGDHTGASSSSMFMSNYKNNQQPEGWSYATALAKIQKTEIVPRMDVASLIEAKRKARHPQQDHHPSNTAPKSTSNEAAPVQQDTLKQRVGGPGEDEEPKGEDEHASISSSEDDDSDAEEAVKAQAFFDSNTQDQKSIEVFSQLALSRPLLRGVAAMGFVKPTPIQATAIPLALAGRDICASAVTGSGKTAAFLLPILERLSHRYAGRTKAVVLTPTRELAAQCVGMLDTLAQFTQITSCLIVGGTKNLKIQAAELRARPDIVVATPGRFLDHLTNTPGVTLEEVEFLILDEADRLLDLGFQDEIHEIIKSCPVQRQTLLFSATMNTKVDELIKLSLKRPVRVKTTGPDSQGKGHKELGVAPRLDQEFVRVRAGNEGIKREAMLLALLTRTYKEHVIVFFDTKAIAHRMMILCGLCGIKCTELHGNLTQQQRLTALEEFRKGEVDVLLATDLAARGLDIDRVKGVINFEMPNQVETYVHRIGRTARAGRTGCSCTLIGEGRRHLMKELIRGAEKKKKVDDKSESALIRSRVIPPAVIEYFVQQIESLEPDIEEVMQAEAVARLDRLAEMEAIRAQNLIEHADEIKSRPAREWFASNKQKAMTKEEIKEKQRMIAEKAGTGTHRMSRKKRRAREAREAFMQQDESDGDDDGGPGDSPRKASKSQPKVSIKSAAREAKRQMHEKEREMKEISISDRYAKKEAEREHKKRKRSKESADATGDSSLFDDEKVTFKAKSTSKKDDRKERTERPSAYAFRGYDPDRKLGKKKSHHAFKSKAKHKRRKK